MRQIYLTSLNSAYISKHVAVRFEAKFRERKEGNSKRTISRFLVTIAGKDRMKGEKKKGRNNSEASNGGKEESEGKVGKKRKEKKGKNRRKERQPLIPIFTLVDTRVRVEIT